MKILLRAIALLAALAVVATLMFMWRFGERGWTGLVASGLLGVATITGWIVTLLAGPVAAIQLARLRPSGRIAALVLFGSGLVYYVAGLAVMRTPDAPIAPLVTACVFFGIVVIVLLTPQARNACSVPRAAENRG